MSAPSPTASPSKPKLLVAASGTGGHLFPAIALAEQLPDFQIEWLGVPDRLETQLVPQNYPLHTINVGGFQQRFGLGSLRTLFSLIGSIGQVRRLLSQGQFQAVVTTGGYIAAPAILAARLLRLPVILHESNALPGKVTRWLSPWCTEVALGFQMASQYLPKAKTTWVGTPVRSQFLQQADSAQLPELAIPPDVPVIAIVGGSQGAVAVNQLVRQAAPAWLDQGAWIVHLTGDRDPEAQSFTHPHYISLPFYGHMAALLQRATLVISRAGAGTLTELAIAGTPSILIPYPYAAEDHQSYNAAVFAAVDAAIVYRQTELKAGILQDKVTELLQSPEMLTAMAAKTAGLAVRDSAEQLASLVKHWIKQ